MLLPVAHGSKRNKNKVCPLALDFGQTRECNVQEQSCYEWPLVKVVVVMVVARARGFIAIVGMSVVQDSQAKNVRSRST